MVDLGFLLLIYFLVVASIQPVEADLDARLGGRGPVIDMPPVEVILKEDGSVLLDQKQIEAAGIGAEMPTLRRELEQLGDLGGLFSARPHIIIELENGAAHQRFASILDALAGTGITQFSLRADND